MEIAQGRTGLFINGKTAPLALPPLRGPILPYKAPGDPKNKVCVLTQPTRRWSAITYKNMTKPYFQLCNYVQNIKKISFTLSIN